MRFRLLVACAALVLGSAGVLTALRALDDGRDTPVLVESGGTTIRLVDSSSRYVTYTTLDGREISCPSHQSVLNCAGPEAAGQVSEDFAATR